MTKCLQRIRRTRRTTVGFMMIGPSVSVSVSESESGVRPEPSRIYWIARKNPIEEIAVKGISDCRVEWGCTAVTAWCCHLVASHEECSVDSRL